MDCVLLLLLFAFRDLWKEWGDSNVQIFSQNCQFHHGRRESEHFNVIFLYHSEHYGLIFKGYHIILQGLCVLMVDGMSVVLNVMLSLTT